MLFLTWNIDNFCYDYNKCIMIMFSLVLIREQLHSFALHLVVQQRAGRTRVFAQT